MEKKVKRTSSNLRELHQVGETETIWYDAYRMSLILQEGRNGKRCFIINLFIFNFSFTLVFFFSFHPLIQQLIATFDVHFFLNMYINYPFNPPQATAFQVLVWSWLRCCSTLQRGIAFDCTAAYSSEMRYIAFIHYNVPHTWVHFLFWVDEIQLYQIYQQE